MTSTELLFIGGPADGERRMIRDTEHERRVCVHLPLGFRRADVQREEVVMDSVAYVRHRFSCGDAMVLDGMSLAAVIGALLAGYNPGPTLDVSHREIRDAVYSPEGIPIIERGGVPHLLVMKLPYVPDLVLA